MLCHCPERINMRLPIASHKLIALFLMLISAQPILAQWQGFRLTNNSLINSTGPRSFLVDEANTQHATWSEGHSSGNLRVYYAQKPCDQPWTTPEILNDTTATASLAALALNPDGADVLATWSWSTTNDGDIYCAIGGPGNWTQLQVTNSSNNDRTPTAAIDNAGKIHLSWTSEDAGGNWKVHYANDRSGSFVEQRISLSTPGPFGGGAAPKIALDPNGAPSITYREGNFQMYRIERLWVTHPDSTNWMREYLPSPSAEEFISDHAFDGNGGIHAAITGNDGFGFPANTYYLNRPNGGNWSTAVAVDLVENAEFASLTLNSMGEPQIGLSGLSGNFYTGNAYHAYNDGSSWVNDTIHLFAGSKYAVNPNVALDDQSNAYALCYLDNGINIDSMEIYHFRTGDCQSGGNGLGSEPFAELEAYPNPTTGITDLRFPPGTEIKKLTLMGMDGRILHMANALLIDQGHYRLQLQGVPAGLYLVSARTDSGIMKTRLVVKNL